MGGRPTGMGLLLARPSLLYYPPLFQDDSLEWSEALLHHHCMPSLHQLNARRELAFLVLSGLFLGTMGLLNVLGLTRFINLGQLGPFPVVVAVGVLPYPVTFLCTDVISEIWGERRASQLVWVGLLVNLWILLIVWLGGVLPGFEPMDPATGLPAVDGAGRQPLFFELRRLTVGTVMASMVAYLTAQFMDNPFAAGAFAANGLEADDAVHQGKEGVIPAAAHVLAGEDGGAPLTDQNGSRGDPLTAVTLDAKALGVGIPAVAGGAGAFLVGHGN